MSKESKALEYPAWSEFLAFEQAFLQCLTGSARARRGRPVVREVVKDGIAHVSTVQR